MHCPACNKDFSPVHSRCPDCNGWLRTAKSNNGAPSRPSGSVAVPNGLAAPSNEPSTQKVNAASVGVALPSRPTNKPATPPAAPQAPAASRVGGGLGGESPAPTLGGPPAAAPPRVAAEDNSFGGRGGLGSGWESSGSFAAPTPVAPPASSQWGGEGMATGRLAPPAPPPASSGWGNGVGGPAAPSGGGWGAPAAPNGLGGAPSSGGWGSPAGGLGAAPAASGLGGGGGLGGPSASSWGAPAAPSGPASGGGGGWLGDGGGGGGGGPSAYSPPVSKSSESWLGGGDAPAAAPSSLGPPPAAEMPLELPDHTVAVDLGTPWEEDEATAAGSSNKMIYMILGCLVLGLTVFSAYLFWQNSKLQQKPVTPSTDKDATSFKLGEDTWKKAQADFNARHYEEAQASAELARDLLVPLKGYPKAKQVNNFYNKATTRLAQSLFDQAKRANAAHETNQAIALCTQAATMYAKVKGTAKLQAQAYAYEAAIYRQIGDAAAAEASYKKAHSLNPSGGYASEAREVRAASAPVPVAPAPAPDEPAPVVEQPSMGDNSSAYPTGSRGGGYHSSAPAPAPAAVPAGPAPRSRPVNTYVPPPKRTQARPSDQLPTYNH